MITEIYFDSEATKPWIGTSMNMDQALLSFISGDDTAKVFTSTGSKLLDLWIPNNGSIRVRPAQLSRAEWIRAKDGTYRNRRK